MKQRSKDYHRFLFRVGNRIFAGLNYVGLACAALDENSLLRQARSDTGLSDFGQDDRFLEPMRLVLWGYENEAQLNPIGRHLARVNVLRILKHRLLAEDLFKRFPEIKQRELGDPCVVVGLARSGTTRLHRLLAADPAFLHLKTWESVYPVPDQASFDAKAQGLPEPRIDAVAKALKGVSYLSPQINAVHPLGANEVEEELGLLQHSFSTQIFEAMNRMPSFGEWLLNNDQTYAYEYMIDLLKLISWFRGDKEGQPWVLKTPQHMADLDSLVAVFPGAKLLFPHRDPQKVMGSIGSMIWNGIVRDCDDLGPEWIGPEWLNKCDRMLKEVISYRESSIPLDQQLDVMYADISANWEAEVDRIYQFLGRPLTEQALSGMRSWLASNAQHKHGAHRYALQDFGLSADSVEASLSYYRRRYNIPLETRNPHRA